MRLRQPVEPLDPRQIVAAIEMRRGDMARAKQGALQPRQRAANASRSSSGHGDEGDALRMAATSASVRSHSPLSDRILPRLSSRDSRP